MTEKELIKICESVDLKGLFETQEKKRRSGMTKSVSEVPYSSGELFHF